MMRNKLFDLLSEGEFDKKLLELEEFESSDRISDDNEDENQECHCEYYKYNESQWIKY